MRLPAELVSRLRAGNNETFVAYLTTSDRRGRPNIMASAFTDVVDDQLILMPDLFAQKTKVNLNEQHQAGLSFASDGNGASWVLDGIADVVQWGHPRNLRVFGLSAGEVLERWGDWDGTVEPVLGAADADVRPSVVAQRGVIVFKPTSVMEVPHATRS